MRFLEALEKIRSEDAKVTERIVPVGRLSAEPEGLSIGGELLSYGSRAFEQLCDRFRRDKGEPPVPASYLRWLPKSLSPVLINHHLSQGLNGGNTIALYRRGEEMIGVGRADLARLPGTDVLESVLEGLGGCADDLEITRLSFADDAVRCDLGTYRSRREVRPGDAVFAGVSLTHSLIGTFPTRVEGYLFRLACQNGAVYRECLRSGEKRGGGHRTRRLSAQHPRARQQQRDQIRRLAAEVFGKLSGRISDLNRLTTERANLDHLATNWLRRSRLSPDRFLPLLRQAHAEEGGEPTAYAVMNAFTRVATHRTDLPPNIRNIMARMGGMLAFGHSRLCPQCWSLIAANN